MQLLAKPYPDIGMDAIEITYRLKRAGFEHKDIAAKLEVHPSTVSRAISGKTPAPEVWVEIERLLGFDPRSANVETPAANRA